jgi:Ser/Thr protein kinase RdoA (MazF antagonist)
MAERIFDHARGLPSIGELPRRIIHGDLKISNVLFDNAVERAVCLIDLDTLASGTIAVELGDALRSWCNPQGEETADAHVNVPIFAAAIDGYAEGAPGLLVPAEVESLVPGFETVALTLAARFCSDALEESYFAWDPERFGSQCEHNLARARSQLALADSVRRQRAELSRLVSDTLGLL